MPQEESQPAAAPVAPVTPPSEDYGALSFEEAMQAAVVASQESTESPPFEEPAAPATVPESPVQEVAPPSDAVVQPPENEAVTPEPVDKSLARIMERESALETREATLVAREARYSESAPDLDALTSRLNAFEQAQLQVNIDPVAYLRTLNPNIDLKRHAHDAWNEAEGDAAPKPYLEQKAANQTTAGLVERIAELEQGNQERERLAKEQVVQQEQAQNRANYMGALQTFSESATSDKLPLVTALRAKNPDAVAGHMFHMTQLHGQRTGETLTPEQAAQALEKELGYFQLTAPPKNDPPPPAEQGTSLRNSSTQVQPDLEIVDEDSDDFLRAKAMKAIGIDKY